MNCLPTSFYRLPTEAVARNLVGNTLVRTIRIKDEVVRLAGRIVETEAYGYDDDPASHARMGPTPRNRVMFGEVGRAYVYFTYGNHFCLNVSARSAKVKAGAILIRAIEPIEGVEMMRKFRPVEEILSLTSGPAKLTQALNIRLALNGVDMTDPTSEIYIEVGKKPENIVATPRIGISRATDREWRFVDPSSPYVSRKIRIK